jgi:hypothetical protein
MCVPATEKDVGNSAVPLLKATGDPEAAPSTLNCMVPDGSEFDPIGVTVAVNVSVLPFAGDFVVAVNEVSVLN